MRHWESVCDYVKPIKSFHEPKDVIISCNEKDMNVRYLCEIKRIYRIDDILVS